MNKENMKGRGVALGLMVLGLILKGWALTPTLVVSNETITLSGDQNESIVGKNGSCDNKNGRYIEVQGDSTFIVSEAGTADRGFFCAFIVSSGTATLDLTNLSADRDFRFDMGLVAKGDGRLLVKGRDHVELGGLYSSYGDNFAAPADCPNISFADSDGTVYVHPTGLRLCHRFLEVSLPTSVPWAVMPASTAVVYHAESAILQGLRNGNSVELTNYDLWVDHNSVLSAEMTVVVPSGREFAIQPRTLILPAKETENYYDLYGPSYQQWAFNVELGGIGSAFNLRNHHSFIHTGAIKGTGAFRHTATANQSNAIKMSGSYTFQGPVSFETKNPIEFTSQASLGADGNIVTLVSGAFVKLGTEKTAMKGSVGDVTGPASGDAATILLGENTELRAGVVTGLIDITGSGRDVSSLTRTVLVKGEKVVNEPDDALERKVSAEVMASADVVSFVRTDGLNAFYRKLTSDEVVDLSQIAIFEGAEYKVVARQGEMFANVPKTVRLEIPNGVEATLNAIRSSAVTSSVYVAEGGLVELSTSQPDWRSKLLCVFDPSDEETVTTSAGLLETIADANGGSTVLTYQSATQSTWPLWEDDGPGGLHYVSFNPNDNRRMKASPALAAKFAIVVFGSQFGGGQALFATGGTSSGAYARGGTALAWTKTIVRPSKEVPILATNGIPVWVDGESVNPCEMGFSGGWQIVSIDTTVANVAGIGYRTGYAVDEEGSTQTVGEKFTSAGQNYGEMLFFREVPTEEERQAAERYLATKWGIAYKGSEEDAVVFSAHGKGKVRLNTDVELLGSFKGEIDLNGRELRLSELPKPPDAATAVPAGLLAWFDPEETETLQMSNNRVNKMYRRDGTMSSGEKFLNSGGRMPVLKGVARGDGPVRNWLFYSPYEIYGEEETSSGKGLALRFNEIDQAESANVAKPLTCQTIVMVQDSTAGGGTPFLDTNSGSDQFGNRFEPRKEGAENPVPSAFDPIWKKGSVSTMASGTTYLDGRIVNGSKVGFNGRPEVLAAMRTEGITVGFFADLYYQNNMTHFVEYGEIQGEILMFDRVLTTEQLKDVDAYLAWKWLGVAREGYSVSSGMTIGGLGRVSGVRIGDIPTFAQNFAGAMAMVDVNYTFEIDSDGTVEGKIVQPVATLEFPANCTAHVIVHRGAKAGDYVLVDAGALSEGTVWALQSETKKPIELNVVGSQVVLTIGKPGMALFLR